MDIIADFGYPLPERIICTMLGVPLEDHKLFEAWSRAFIPPPNEAPSEDTRRKATEALLSFIGYLAEKVADRRRHPKDDLMSLLIQVADEGERLSETELLANLFELTVAGHETTANLIGNGVYNLLRHREELRLLQADTTLAGAAVEEVLRFDTPAPHTNVRATTRDCEVAGVAIPADQLVTVVVASANRDDLEFDEADRFRLNRRENRHLGFGWGEHFCMGATLSRVEAQVAFARLFERFPTLDLATDELTWRKGERIHSLEALPVAW
jgi:cytochrome P450